MIWIGPADRAAAPRWRDSFRSLASALSGLALGLITQVTMAQQTLEHEQAPGIVVQHPSAAPNVTRQPEQGVTPLQQQQPLQSAPGVPPAGIEENVDTTGIWYRLRLHDLNGAEAEFTRLSQAHPGWKPPADLIFALRSAKFDAAKARGNIGEMRRLAASIGSFDRCAHPDLAWSMAEVPGIGERQTLLDMARHCTNPGIAAGSMDRFLRGVPPTTRMATIASLAQQQWPQSVRQVLDGARLQASLDALATGHPTAAQLADAEAITNATRNAGAAVALGWHYFNSGDAAKAVQWFSTAISWGGDSSAHEGLARSLLAQGNVDAVKTMVQSAPALRAPLADALLAQALTRIDQGAPMSDITADVQGAVGFGKSDAWETVGWRLLDHHRAEDALTAFMRAPPTENVLLGRVLATRAAGHEAAASNLACEQRSQSPRLAQACADAIASEQLAAYKAGNYAAAEKLGDQLAEIAPDRRDARALTAWSALRAGDTKKAADIFAVLYDQNHASDLAEGLAQSSRASGQTEALADRIAAGDKMLSDLITRDRNADVATALGRHYLAAGNATQAAQWFASATAWGGGASARAGLNQSLGAAGGIAAVNKTLLQAAPALRAPLADSQLARALTGADHGAPMSEIATDVQSAVDLGRSDAWETVGWRLFDHHRFEDALTAFTRAAPTENAIFGRVLAARAAGHEAEASSLACEQRSLSKRLAQACADSIASRQLSAYNAGNYVEAEKLGDQLAEIAPDRRDARALTAWSAYHAGDPKKAARIFAELYDQNHDHDLANGLALSLRASGQTQVLTERVAAGDKTLGDIVAAENADTAWYRKQFDLAATGPSPNPSLAGRSGWLVGTGIETALISGSPGEDRFNAAVGRVFAEGMVGPVRLGISVIGGSIDIGTPPPDALIGLRPLPDQVAPTSGAGIIQPEMNLRWETPGWTTTALLGLTPLNTEVGPLPTASASVTHYMDPVILSGRVFAQGVTNSLLSYGGMRDPVTGTAWGRVMDMGGSLQAIYLPVDRVSLSFTGEGAYLVGDNVVSNNRLSLRFDAAYDFRPENFDHLRLGPFVSFVHYERNLDFFTFGNGGYYSPDSDTRVGALLDLLTAEGRRWQIEFKQSLAYGNVSEASALRYPLSDSLLTFSGSRFAGVDADTQFRTSALLSEHLILSGFAGYSNAPGYKGFVAGLFLSIPFEARRGVFSTDLPDSSFRPFSVWK
jgi:cellulose synthase operon protein C